MNKIKKIIKRFIPVKYYKLLVKWKNIFFDNYSIKSYSQEGEDIILREIFEDKKIGFYVDVGAHHPYRFSNTYFFYKQGWQGINIDAMPNSMKLFKKFRPRDINLEIAIYNEKKIMTYYVFNEPALNTFSKEVAENKNGLRNYKVIQKIKIETKTLSEVLDEYLLLGQEIDFLTIDVEGFDFEVLKSNNWEKYRPEIVLVEVLGETLENLQKSDITLFLKGKGYTLFAKSFRTVFFKRI